MPRRPRSRPVAVALLGAALLAAGCGNPVDPAPGPEPAGGDYVVAADDRPSAPLPAPPPTVTAAPSPPASPAPSGTAPRAGGGGSPDAAPGPATGRAVPPDEAPGGGADVRDADRYAIGCGQDEATVAASGAPRVTRGEATIYIGTAQVSGANQDPRVVRFDGGRQTWCRDDLERGNDDGRGYGLLWSGDLLLAVVSATGTQGDPSGDLRRFTGSGWLRHYSDASPGGGGGPKVAAVVALDPATGAGVPGVGTWLTALTGAGKVNSLLVTSLERAGDGVRVGVASWYSPRRADRTAMTCEGSSPFTVTYTFDASLRSVTDVRADSRCR
jgi:hypothetical protein